MTEWMAAHGGLTGMGVQLAKVVLCVFATLSVVVVIERLYALGRLRKFEESDYRALKEAFAQGQVDLVRACAMASLAPSAAALQAGLELASGRGMRPNAERVREAIDQEVEVQNASLQHNLPILATVASTAPYVGLFGTVLGILGAFHDIALTGQTRPSVVASGISEALITTALGLGVAIPAVVVYNYFSGRVNTFSLRVETHAIDLAGRLADLHEAEGGIANSERVRANGERVRAGSGS